MQPRLRSARPILQLGRSQATFRLFHLASLLHIGPRSERNRASERVGHCQCPVAVTWMVTNVCFVVALAMLGGGTPLFAQDEQVRLALDDLVAAYPYALAGHDAKVLRWRDGTVMPVYDGADSSGVLCERDAAAAPWKTGKTQVASCPLPMLRTGHGGSPQPTPIAGPRRNVVPRW